MNYEYHHIGLPTKVPRQNEEYNKEDKFFASGYWNSKFGIEWLRFEDDSPLHPLIKTVPHVAFVVEEIEEAILGKTIILQHSPAQGVKVCFIEHEGAPIEFLQFDRLESEIWPNSKKLINKVNSNSKQKLIFEYHHFGICMNSQNRETNLINKENFCPTQINDPYGLSWMKFKKDSELPDLVKNISHVAFKVNDIYKAIRGNKLIVKPKKLSDSVSVAYIEENGVPIKLLQFDNN